MPEITRFYGIILKMFYKPKEHEPSHIHAIYNENIGIFDIQQEKMKEGDLPKRAEEMVIEWIKQNKNELQKMWDNQQIKKLPPLK